MGSDLSRVPVRGRRQLAATLLLFATLFLAIGAVAATGGGTTAAPVFCAVALVVAVLLALIGWGLLRSVKLDLAEQRLDAAIQDALAAEGGQAALCGCGHDHDPDELHVASGADSSGAAASAASGRGAAEPTHCGCAHDGSGTACAHDCESCVLGALRH